MRDFIDVADTVSRREPDWVARFVFLKCYRRRYSEHDGSWPDCWFPLPVFDVELIGCVSGGICG